MFILITLRLNLMLETQSKISVFDNSELLYEELGVIPTIKQFSDGSIYVNLKLDLISKTSKIIVIKANLKDPLGLLALPSLVALIRTLCPTAEYRLIMPFVPCGRQDRVTGEGFELNAFTLKHTVAPIINSCNFSQIVVCDAHSNVTGAVFNALEFIDISQTNLIKTRCDNTDFNTIADVVVSPDAGASKKAAAVAPKLPIIVATKNRNLVTMELTDTEIYGNVEGKICLIPDDICDGGRTFINLAKKLKEKGATKVILLVTHGIFSYGFEPLREYIDHVYVIYNWKSEEETPKDFVTSRYYF